MSRISVLLKNLRYMSKTDLRKRRFFDLDIADIITSVLYFIPNSGIIRPNVLNGDKTVDLICHSQKSLARFGDGEIAIIHGQGIPFQKYDERLADRLRKILKNDNDNLLVGINYWYFYPVYDPNRNQLSRDFVLFTGPKCRNNLIPLLDFSTMYCDAGFTGTHRDRNSNNSDDFWQKIKTVWDNRDIVCVGCQQAHKKLKYNLFDNAASEHWVYVPNKNAFDEYDDILAKIKNYPKNRLIILMAGPTSKVLADDLSMAGYRALDLGHIAKSYDFYMRGTELTTDAECDFWSPDE